MNSGTSTIIDKLFMLKAPFNQDQLLDIRREILGTMKHNTFDYYMSHMNQIRDMANQVITNEVFLLDDNYWKKMDLFEKPYWMTESPYLHELYKSHRSTLTGSPTSTTSSISNMIMSDIHVNKLIGEATWMTVQQKILFKSIITTYFRKNIRLWPIHLNMDFTFMESRANVHDKGNMESIKSLFKSLLSGSGPFILKILQQINVSNQNKIAGNVSVAELTKDIFTNVPGLTPSEVEFVTSSFNIPQSYLKNMNPEILGSASIAEIHKTYSDAHKQPAVLKFIKPLYAFYFLCELNFLLTDVWKHIASESKGNVKHIRQCRKLTLFFIQEFIKEFDYYSEFVNTTIGHTIYNKPREKLGSIVALECQVNPFPVIILNYVEGESLDKKNETHKQKSYIELYKQVDNLIKLWFKEALWGSGFFHADLHMGNLIRGNDGLLYTIDFGSCGILSHQEQCGLITAMIISGQFINHSSKLSEREIRSKNLKIGVQFVKTIWKICHVKNYSDEHLHAIAQKIVDKRYKSKFGLIFSSLFIDIIEHSDDIGICVNSPILLFGRGCAYISSVMKNVQELCDSNENCPVWSMNGVITSNLIVHPLQLVKFYSTGHVCQA
jgi:hypothetical protein